MGERHYCYQVGGMPRFTLENGKSDQPKGPQLGKMVSEIWGLDSQGISEIWGLDFQGNPESRRT